MINVVVVLTLTGPLLLAGVAALSHFDLRSRNPLLLVVSRIATGLSVLLAIGVAAYTLLVGPTNADLLGFDPVAFSIRLDAFSVMMLGLVAFVGMVVVQFSRRYLDGEERQGIFIGRICLTLCAVSMLVISGSLLQLVVAWIGTSVALHRLLLFYADRPKAIIAARKKFICARIGDLFLIVAAILLYVAFGTGDITQILELARELTVAGAPPISARGAAVFIVLAAAFKSAQFPAQGWLTEVMETPTPVSALLHAGIVNAGGFLVIRFSDVVVLSTFSLHLLIIIGGLTALVGTVVMLTQTNIKSTLAWSTISQMGFMLLQCGFGAFSAAALHIVAHSLYKAHAFLSSGGAVLEARAPLGNLQLTPPKPQNLLAACASAGLIFLAVATIFNISPAEKPAIVALGAILVIGLSPMLAKSLSGPHVESLAGRFLITVGAVSMLYCGLQHAAYWVMADVVAPPAASNTVSMVLAGLFVVLFGTATLLQLYFSSWATRWPGIYVHITNGFYVNALFDRLLGSFRKPAAVRS